MSSNVELAVTKSASGAPVTLYGEEALAFRTPYAACAFADTVSWAEAGPKVPAMAAVPAAFCPCESAKMLQYGGVLLPMQTSSTAEVDTCNVSATPSEAPTRNAATSRE